MSRHPSREPQAPPVGERAEPQRRLEAAAALLRTGPREAETFLRAIAGGGPTAGDFWVALDRDGAYTAAVLAAVSAGRTAMCFATPPANRAEVERIASLLARASLDLHGEDVVLAQALLSHQDRLSADAYERAGYRHLAILQYMERSTIATPPLDDDPDVRFVSADDVDEDVLEATLEATYEASLDCRGLHGLRATSDIIAGHRATAIYDPALWSLIEVEGQPAGVLLLNLSHEPNMVELVYVGLIPCARGRGLGRRTTIEAIRQVQARRRGRLALAVDRKNAPAMGLYRSLGFRSLQRRLAMICPL